MVAELDAAAVELHGKLSKLRSRFGESEEKFQLATLMANERVEEVKDYQSALHH